MKLIPALTLRQMSRNKARTSITVVGVVVSTAMIFAVLIIAGSVMNTMMNEAALSSGGWHAQFTAVPAVNLPNITDDPRIGQSTLLYEPGFVALPKKQEDQLPYGYLYQSDNFELLPITLEEGRLPQAPGEVAISNRMARLYGDELRVGDTFTAPMGRREVTDPKTGETQELSGLNMPLEDNERFAPREEIEYTITGIVDAAYMERYSSPAYLMYGLLTPDELPAETPVTLRVTYARLNNSIIPGSGELAHAAGDVAYNLNTRLLAYAGLNVDQRTMGALWGLVTVIGAIIFIGSVSVIRNAFAISLAERSRMLGMLASVGATRSQKRNILLLEAAVVGAIGIPIGLLSGYIGIAITLRLLSGALQDTLTSGAAFMMVVSWQSVAACVVFAAIMLLVSVMLPALRAARISPIEAIRQNHDITLRRGLRPARLTRLLFGFEGELALKNIKRNRSRYRTTLLSLIISIVLFLSVSTFASLLQTSFAMTTRDSGYQLQTYIQTRDDSPPPTVQDDYIQTLLRAQNATGYQVEQTVYAVLSIAQDEAMPDMKTYGEPYNGQYDMQLTLVAMDDAAFDRYCKTVAPHLDSATIQGGILVDNLPLRQGNSFVQVQQLDTRAGDTLQGWIYGHDEDSEDIYLPPITVAAVTDQLPPTAGAYMDYIGVAYVYMPMRMMSELGLAGPDAIPEAGGRVMVWFSSDDPMALEDELNDICLESSHYSMSIYNATAAQRSNEQSILMINTFLYGFIVLICVISLTNIVNTTVTGIQLRTREFAMLKSVGITPKSFGRMLRYESLLYAVKSTLYGLPLALGCMLLMHRMLDTGFSFAFTLPWRAIIYCVVGVFVVVSATTILAGRRADYQSITEALRNENL